MNSVQTENFFSPVRATFCDDDAHFEFKRRSFPLSAISYRSSAHRGRSAAQRSAAQRQHVWPPARPRRWRRPSSWCFISDTENHASPDCPACLPACLPACPHKSGRGGRGGGICGQCHWSGPPSPARALNERRRHCDCNLKQFRSLPPSLPGPR